MIKTIEEHFKDMRKSIFVILFCIILSFGLAFYFSPKIISFILDFMSINNPVALSPFESITTQLRLSIGITFLLFVPMLFLLIYNFLKDEISEKVKKKLLLFIAPVFILGVVGMLFGSFVFSKFVLDMLIGNALVETMFSIKSIMDFIVVSGTTFALIFQIIIIIPLIVNVGLISKKSLRALRIPIFIITLLLSAAITPPDLISMFLMVIPIYSCFELGVLFSKNQKGVKEKCSD